MIYEPSRGSGGGEGGFFGSDMREEITSLGRERTESHQKTCSRASRCWSLGRCGVACKPAGPRAAAAPSLPDHQRASYPCVCVLSPRSLFRPRPTKFTEKDERYWTVVCACVCAWEERMVGDREGIIYRGRNHQKYEPKRRSYIIGNFEICFRRSFS